MTDTERETAPAESVPAVESSEPAPQAPEQWPQAEGEEPEAEGSRRPNRTQRYQRRIALLTAENDDLRRRASAVHPADGGWPAQEWPPQEAEFNGNTAAYERALNAHHVRQAAREAVRQEAERERGERLLVREAEAHREHVVAHLERVEELKDLVPDFHDAMKVAATINMRQETLDEILRSENSALVQYYLAKNPEKARALNGLTGRELARAVGRLESAVRLPVKRATGATPPVPPLTGAAGPSFDPARAEMAAYAADYKRRQQARQRG
jgi:hypothetical protein